jgi:hypothetical protein
MDIFDPWNIDPFILKFGKNIILGPLKDVKLKIRHNIEFIYEEKDDNIYYLYTINNESSDFKHLYIKFDKDETIIENISKSKLYSGSEFVLLGLQIIYRLTNKIKCKLIDASFFVCDRKINIFSEPSSNIISKKEEIQYKLILLFKFGSTFYSPFGFISYNKKNMNIETDNIMNLVSKLWDITWHEIDSYIIKMIHIVLSNKYKNNIMIRNYRKWFNYWIHVNESWNKFKNKYAEFSPTPFRSFSFFNNDECGEFINWLELYSFTYFNYNQFVFNNINNSKKEIAGIFLFKKLKNLINNVVWINNNVTSQPMISIYKK